MSGITDRLCAELRARSERGVQKYGVSLDAANLTPAQILQHAKEEALDLAAYLQKLIDIGSAADRIAKDPWSILGVDRNATPAQIVLAHRIMAKRAHQDGSDGRMDELNQARAEALLRAAQARTA